MNELRCRAPARLLGRRQPGQSLSGRFDLRASPRLVSIEADNRLQDLAGLFRILVFDLFSELQSLLDFELNLLAPVARARSELL